MKTPDKNELRNKILLFIANKRNEGAHIHDLVSIGDYDDIQYALMWLEYKGLISGSHTKQIGKHNHDILRATITLAGIEYIDNGFIFPVPKIAVILDEDQLERIFIGMATKFGKPDDASRIKKFIEKAGNAGINALATESVKHMIANLPEIASRLC